MDLKKHSFKLWNVSRSIRKIVLCFPILEELKEKGNLILVFIKFNITYNIILSHTANKTGLPGDKIVLESDGSEIEDNESLTYFNKEVLQILNNNEAWYPASSILSSIPEINFYTINNMENFSENIILSNGLPRSESLDSTLT